jgi:DNA polymerase (family X)
VLDELADLMQLKGDTFRANAYRRAARSVGQVEGLLQDALDGGRIQALPGVGESITKKLQEYATTGKVQRLEEYRAALPKGLLEIMAVPGLGPKRAMVLHKELRIDSLTKLKEACEQGKLLTVKGFGLKSQDDILRNIALLKQGGQRLLLPEAQRAADELVPLLAPHCSKLEVAGSLRRRRDTIGDLDLIALPKRGHAARIGQALAALEGATPLAMGERKVSVRTAKGLQVDVRIVTKDEFGAAMMYFTGSKAHNIRLRAMAIKRGWKLNEYGLFEEHEGQEGKRIAGADEDAIYERLGMAPVPPELREDSGEVEAALADALPPLVALGDLKGDLHNHTNRSDGLLAPLAWVQAAAEAGLEYIGLTDHSIGLPGWGLTGAQLIEHRHQVLELADKYAPEVEVFVGTEANILKDGSLDLPANELDQLDYVVAGVHTNFQMGPDEMTRRLVQAMEDGRIDVWSHPTGRKIGQREPHDYDRDKVFAAAAASKTALELDAQPDRLDLNGELARKAKAHGCRFAIDSDGHGTPRKDLLRWGVDQARRGWLEPTDVVNTLPAGQLLKALKRR